MDKLDLFLSLSITVFSLLVSTITFLMKFIKNSKARKTAEQILKFSNEIIPIIEQAEKFVHYSGTEKKEYVMTKAIQLAINNKMRIDNETISDKIEELVSLTNHVNTNKNIKELQNILTGKI